MGFCYAYNPITRRQVLACDTCGGYPAKKIPCPVKYCQDWAACATCAPKVRRERDHSHCIKRHAELQAAKDSLRAGICKMHLETRESFGKTYFVISEDDIGLAACCLFNKTWVDAREIDLMRQWGNTVIEP